MEAYLVPAPDPTSFARTLHWSGGFLFRSNGIYLNTISEFSPEGTLKATIAPTTSQWTAGSCPIW